VPDNAPISPEKKLRDDISACSRDPYKFVLYSFPWGKGDLVGCTPEDWQVSLLKRVRDGLISYQDAILEAIASGHGIGKSALVAWLILWALSTFEETRGIVTANTQLQLMTKTWPELSKWYNRFIARHWFVLTATAIYSAVEKYEKTWRIDAVPWSRNKEMQTEAFAGLHNKGKRIIVIFDEASAIPDAIHEVTEGALTDDDTEILWFKFGNPTRNTGTFHAAFHRLKHRWHHEQIDSRNVRISNKKQLNKWIEDYGENSDFVKIRVKGEFPAVGDRQFISTALVDAARGKHLGVDKYDFAPVILTCDPSWTGSDELVIGKRQGLAFSILKVMAKNDDDTLVAGFIAGYEDEFQADAVFIDLGYGTGIYSAGKQMNRRWTLVSFGGASSKPGYANKRAEMYGDIRDWLKEGGALPDDAQLCEELPSVEAETRMNGEIILESKEDMKERGLSSPNRADALALSFAFPVRKKVRNDPKRRMETAEPPEGYKVYA
jgi:hypothetical protein